MGILSRLKTQKSKYSNLNGGTAPIQPGATKQSKLHAFNDKAGYGLNGNFQPEVSNAFNLYRDGIINNLPFPSQLDLNGKKPSQALKDSNTKGINNTFSRGTYRNNTPEGRDF